MDKYTLENVLTLTKSLITLYENGTVESSNKKVRSLMENGLSDTLNMQDTLYQTMKDDGYYNVQNVKETEVLKLYDKLNEDTN
ncbi:MAG: spore coat protein [Bacilli bacterium]|nr:spore coat protein [Bacilli bacterium]